MGPGFPGAGGGQNNQQIPSTVGLARADKILIVSIDLDWKKEYPNLVSQSLKDYFDGVGGQAMLHAGANPWHKLPAALDRFRAAKKFPRAAYSRRTTAARLGLPFAPELR